MPSTHSKTSVCILQVTTTGNDVVPVDKEVLQPVVENGDVITQQQSNPNEEFTAAEKQLISIPTAGPSFKEFIPTPKKALRSSSSVRRRVGHAEVITTSPYKQNLVVNKAKKKPKLSQVQVQGKRRTATKKISRQPTNTASGESVTNADVDRTPCTYCEILYCESTVQWHRCRSCGLWACATCANIGHKRAFVCDSCK